MTRIFTDGAEMGDVLFWDTTTFTASTTFKRAGSYAYKGAANQAATKYVPAVSEGYLRFSLYWNGTPGNESRLPNWYKNTTELGSLRLNNSTKKLDLYVGGSLVDTGTIAFQASTHYLIELHIKMADSEGIVEVKVDGVVDSSYSGDTKPGSDTTFDRFTFTIDGFSPDTYIDDLGFNDTDNSDGKDDNSWCGDGKIVAVFPNANGDSSQLTGSDGNSTDNYLLVDDLPNNGDTDYVVSGTAGQYDLYNLGAVSLPAGYTIGRVYAECRSREELAGGDSIQLGIKPSGGSEAWSANRPQITSYARYVGTEYKVNPADSGAWEEADINALQAGVKVV
jgi:hypothetical protein